MRKSSFLRLCLCLVVLLFELPLMAQSVVVCKKDGTHVKFAYEEIDSIVPYNVGEDVEDEPVTPPAAVDVEAVDLGLSVKWAPWNLGATYPGEFGDYFAWGETTPKSDYSSSTSITYGLSISELESRGIIDADGNLTAAYDAATANWGGNWRMPTLDEMSELFFNCSWVWRAQNGTYGFKVTGPNGNSIFLPFAGYFFSKTLHSPGSEGFYWLATPKNDYTFNLFLSDDNGSWLENCSPRFQGFTVRPVSE